MKLLNIKIQGYRSLYEVEWIPGDLNVVIGPNGSGKSNLLKVLELFAFSARGGLGNQIRREGGMEPIVWDGSISKINFKLKTTPFLSNLSNERENLTYCLELARLGISSTYRIEHEQLANFFRVEIGEKDSPFLFLDRNPHSSVIFDEHERGLSAPQESVPEEETLLSLAAGPFTANQRISEFQKYIASWQIYQDFQTHREAPVRQPALARPETAVAVDGSNLIPVLHTLYTGSREFKYDINKAMSAAFGGDFEELIFPPAADSRIQLRIRWRSLKREQTTSELSDGTLRFLFLIAILANPQPPELIAFDEPETGLHPSMLPIVAEYSAEAALRTQVIFTTHSAEFLNTFEHIVPTTTIVKWEDGKSSLQIVSDEALQYWLKEYTLGKLYLSGELEEMV